MLKGDYAYDDNFEFNIYSARASSKLENDTVFIEINHCNKMLYHLIAVIIQNTAGNSYILYFSLTVFIYFFKTFLLQSPPFDMLHHIYGLLSVIKASKHINDTKYFPLQSITIILLLLLDKKYTI